MTPSPGLSCLESEADREYLAIYLEAIRRAQELGRSQIRQHAMEAFTTDAVSDRLVDALDNVRKVACEE